MATLVEISSVTLPLRFLPQVNYAGEEEPIVITEGTFLLDDGLDLTKKSNRFRVSFVSTFLM